MNADKQNNDSYEETAKDLDAVVTTVVTTLLTSFIVSQQFFGITNTLTKVAAIFAVATLFLHFISFVSAHRAQIYKVQKRHELKGFFTRWTKWINGIVHVFVVIMFAISIAIIIHSGG